jgi:6-phosphofructokinase
LASRLGAAAIDALMEDQRNVMIELRTMKLFTFPYQSNQE